MIGMHWIRKLFGKNTLSNSTADRYWEAEGLCRMETIPQLVSLGVTGAPTLASTTRKYCVRR
jgi:hypothetical protein